MAAPRRVVETAIQDSSLARSLGISGEVIDTRADFDKITKAAAAGNDACAQLIEQSAFYVAKALVSVTNLLDLDRIILAGPAFNAAADIYLRSATEELNQYSFVRAVHPTTITVSKAGQDSAAMGAAALVLHSRLTPHQTSRQLAAVRLTVP